MDFSAIAAQIDSVQGNDKREPGQLPGRIIGHVVSCTGSRATLTCDMSGQTAKTAQSWSIGSLVSIDTGTSRIVGFVHELHAADRTWRVDGANTMFTEIELVGEVTDQAGGKLHFQRGIQNYPNIGSEAHCIRSTDLSAIYDLGERPSDEIGRLSQDDTIAATINIDDMLKRHFAVVGTTGVGKSNAVSILIRKAIEAKPNLRVLILDPHNEFAAAFRGEASVLDAATFELPFWLFKLEEFVDAIFRGREAPEGEIEFLREAITQAKGMYNSRVAAQPSSILKRQFRAESETLTADTPVPFRMIDIFALIEDAMGKLEPRYSRADLRSLKSRLDSLTNDPRFGFLFGKAALEDTIEPVLAQIFRIPARGQRITILQLAGIPSEVTNAVVSVLARMAFDIAMMSAGGVEVLLLCEEAHRYVPANSLQGFLPTRQAIARIAKEGRKYGCYLGVVTQRPGELDPTILSQCSTVFAMRLANEHDKDIIRSAIPDSSAGVLGFLSSIGNREAIAFGEAVATPMRMRFAFLAAAARPMTAWSDNAARNGNADTGADLRTIVDRMRGQAINDVSNTVLPQAGSASVEPAPPAQQPAQQVPHGSPQQAPVQQQQALAQHYGAPITRPAPQPQAQSWAAPAQPRSFGR